MSPPNLAQFRLPSSKALYGRQLVLDLVEGGTLSLQFSEDGHVIWKVQYADWRAEGFDSCDVVEVGQGTYFVDIELTGQPLDAITLLVNPERGHGLLVHQHRTPGADPAVAQHFLAARVEGVASIGAQPALTDELRGRWHRLRYAPENLYQHIYINAEKMVSHNLDTRNTPDRADCHDATYWKFDDQLYLMGWRERGSEAGMIMCENLVQMRATGKVFHPMSPDRSGNAPIGGHIYPAQIRFPADVPGEPIE